MKRLLFAVLALSVSSFAFAEGWSSEYEKIAVIIAECDVHKLQAWKEQGGDLNIQDDKGNRPVHLAVMDKSSLPCLKWLLDEGVNVNVQASNGATPIIYAAFSDNDEALLLLDKAGANPFIKDKAGNNLFYIALMSTALVDGVFSEEIKNIIKYSREIYIRERDKKLAQ